MELEAQSWGKTALSGWGDKLAVNQRAVLLQTPHRKLRKHISTLVFYIKDGREDPGVYRTGEISGVSTELCAGQKACSATAGMDAV